MAHERYRSRNDDRRGGTRTTCGRETRPSLTQDPRTARTRFNESLDGADCVPDMAPSQLSIRGAPRGRKPGICPQTKDVEVLFSKSYEEVKSVPSWTWNPTRQHAILARRIHPVDRIIECVPVNVVAEGSNITRTRRFATGLPGRRLWRTTSGGGAGAKGPRKKGFVGRRSLPTPLRGAAVEHERAAREFATGLPGSYCWETQQGGRGLATAGAGGACHRGGTVIVQVA